MRKIDIYFMKDYLCTTEQSKTCKEAKRRFIEKLERDSHTIGGLGRLEAFILKHPKELKARFQK